MKQALVVASNTRVLDSITEAIAKVMTMTVLEGYLVTGEPKSMP